MMLKNLVCSAFLAAALASSPTFMSTIPTTASPTTTPFRIDILPNLNEGDYPEGFDHRKPVHVVVDLGSSKSRIYAVKGLEWADDTIKLESNKAWYPENKNKIQTKVLISGELVKKGVAGACRTVGEPAWSTDELCEKHLDDIATTLQAADDKLNILSVRFLGTAGLRQSPQGVETLQKLQEKIESITFQRNDMEFEYRTLSGEEEAENEFLALKSVKDVVAGPDQTGDNELVGMIGLGGASVQFAVEEEANDAGKKNLSVESVPHGLDAAWDQLGSDGAGGSCKIKTDNPNSTNIYTECEEQVKATFTSLFQQNDPAHWVQDHLKVYASGGIYHSIKDHFGKTNLDHTRRQLYEAAQEKCNTYQSPVEGETSYTKFQCFRLTYIVHVIDSLGINADKVIHFRDEIVDGQDTKKVQWVRAAAMKQNKPYHELLQAYVDTTSRTAAQVEAYNNLVKEYKQRVKAEADTQ